MFIFRRVINLFLSLLLTISLAILLAITIFFISTFQIISDRENLRNWISEDEVRNEFIEYVIDESYNSNSAIIIRNLVNREDFEEAVREGLSDETSVQITNQVVDDLYDWLNGDKDKLDAKLSIKDSELDLTALDNIIDEKLGVFGQLVDASDLILFSDKLNLLNLEKLSLSNAPELYQQIETVPKKLIIAMLVIAAAIIVFQGSMRRGLLLIGIAFAAVGGYMLFGKEYYPFEELLKLARFPIGIPTLPSLSDSPQFIRSISQLAQQQIWERIREYSIYSLILGTALIIATQLEISESTVEEDVQEDKEFE